MYLLSIELECEQEVREHEQEVREHEEEVREHEEEVREHEEEVRRYNMDKGKGMCNWNYVRMIDLLLLVQGRKAIMMNVGMITIMLVGYVVKL